MAKPPIATGSLFEDRAHKAYMEFTLRQYGHMKTRWRKKLKNDKIDLPFSLTQFREQVLRMMGGKEDGVIQCRYCKVHLTIEGIAVDHATPLSRNGSPGPSRVVIPTILGMPEIIFPKDLGITIVQKGNELTIEFPRARMGCLLATSSRA